MLNDYRPKYIISSLVQVVGAAMLFVPYVCGSFSKERPEWVNPFMFESGMIFFYVGAVVMAGGFIYGVLYMSKETIERQIQTRIMKFVLPDAEPEYLMAAHGPRFWCTLHSFKEKLFYMLDETDINERFKTPEDCAIHIYDMLMEEAKDRSVDWEEIP